MAGVTYVALDLATPESIAVCAAEVLAHGVPEVLVNNAGESQSGPFEELPRDAVERLFQVNVVGHVDFTQRLVPAMRQAGRGKVIGDRRGLGGGPAQAVLRTPIRREDRLPPVPGRPGAVDSQPHRTAPRSARSAASRRVFV